MKRCSTSVSNGDAVDGRKPIPQTDQRYELAFKFAFAEEGDFDFSTSTSDFCVQRLLIAGKLNVQCFLAILNFYFDH